ncbi:MAG: cytidylate kinase-like family protein [Acidimicrobiia bacterium]|nr:cytidylate kinase-like family protein [Acidimicrobiia bacterium]
MSQVIVERYLKAHAADAKAAAERERGPRAHPFVTISRQAGAGGTTLAERLLEAFAEQEDRDLFDGWQVFDRALCEIVAKDPNYRHSIDALLTEEYPSRTADFFRQVIGSTIDHGVLMDRVFRVVRSLAAIGKAIIIGRAGSQVTKDMPNGLSLRLVSPEERRIQHLAELEDLTERKARSEVRKRDESRARLLKAHFNVDINDPAGYDLTWNTGTCTTEEMVDTIVTMLRHRATRTVSRQVMHH